LAGLALAAGSSAGASVIEFTDRDAWFDAVGSVTTIGFTEYPNGTLVMDQYEEQGVLFTDGLDTIFTDDSFINDGAGLDGNGFIELTFLSPQFYIAVDFPIALRISLFRQGELIYLSDFFGTPSLGDFAGLISSDPFDSALIADPALPTARIDDLHYGVPAPGSLAVLGVSVLFPRRRRKWSAS
jgi:uncharacterized protein (TIGR03382 family)